ncbi:MAG TPA: DUF4105 domain-containing protein [Gemmatimonadaceae bacterium]|nr:DUF4105 domain-containing protein [Gemmatimonadaceae bacterium]
MRTRIALRLLLAAVTAAPVLNGQQQAAPAPTTATQQPLTISTAEPGSDLTVYLLTFGWGDAVWERFGHNAIWIKDRAHNTDLTYNWGMFDFNQPHFIWRFVTGDTRYWMEPIDLQAMVRYYRQFNRSILAQELNLTPAQRVKLQQYVTMNALPQNKFYRYDYYRDNCSTRLRDALDHALGGQLQTSTVSRMTQGTYRWHTQRLMTGDLPLYTGVTLALGRPADKPLSMWEEMFLPVRMANDLRTVTVADSIGNQSPLVRSESTLFIAGRAPEPATAPGYLPIFVAIGIIYAAVLVILVRSAEGGGKGSLFGATLLATLWSLIAGIGGLALIFAWFFTSHHFMGRNENLMQFDPLSIALVVMVPLAMYTVRAHSRTVTLAGWIAAISLFGCVAQGIPFFYQKNGEIIALALPINLAVWWTVYRLSTYRRTSLPSSAAL